MELNTEVPTIPIKATRVTQTGMFASYRPFKNLLEQSQNYSSRSHEASYHPQETPFVAVNTPTSLKPTSKASYAQLSKFHGRAIVDQRLQTTALWGWQGKDYTIPFGARDYKGTIMQGTQNHIPFYPELERDETTPYGWRVNGVKDSVGIQRLQKSSKFFLEHGLPTEIPADIYRLDEILIGKKFVPIRTWKQQALKYGSNPDLRLTNEDRKKIETYLKTSEFFIIDRDVQVAERFRDTRLLTTMAEWRTFFTPIFQWVNVTTATLKSGIIPKTPQPEPFDILKQEDIQRYFIQWLPRQMGIYLARMHNLGVALGYAHAQNWSCVGTLYDLDSVKGVFPQWGVPATDDYKKDLTDSLKAVRELLDPSNYTKRQSDLNALLAPHLTEAIYQLAATYRSELETLGNKKLLNEFNEDFFALYGGFEGANSPDLLQKLAPQ